MTKAVKNYEKACLDMAVEFVNGFYADFYADCHSVEYTETRQEVLERFVSQDPTGILELCDMWISIGDIYQFYVCGATYQQFVGWYWKTTEGEEKISLKHYLKLK